MINKIVTNLASTSEEPTLIEELWDYFVQKYLTPDYGVYENISIDRDPLVTPAMIIIAGFIAVMAGASVMIFTKRVLGRLVRRLIKNDALSPDRAKTLDELGLGNSKAIRLFINRMTLSKAVRCREEDEYYGIGQEKPSEEAEESEETDVKEPEAPTPGDAYKVSLCTPSKLRYKRDPKKDHFYVPEEKKHHLSVRFEKKGTNPVMLLVLAVIYIAIALIAVRILPSLLEKMDAAASGFKDV